MNDINGDGDLSAKLGEDFSIDVRVESHQNRLPANNRWRTQVSCRAQHDFQQFRHGGFILFQIKSRYLFASHDNDLGGAFDQRLGFFGA